jgi:hypothetical protein
MGMSSGSNSGISIQPQKLKFESKTPDKGGTKLSFRDTESALESLKKINRLYPGRKILPKKITYKKGFFEFKRLAKDISELVNDIERLFYREQAVSMKPKEIDGIIKKANTYHKKYKYDPNVRVLYAISKYYLILAEKPANPLEQMHNVVKEIGQAILNDGLTAYNMRQFVVVYNQYIEMWKKQVVRTIHRTPGQEGSVGKLKIELENRLIKVDRLKFNEDLLRKDLTVYREILNPDKIKDALDTIQGEASARAMHLANIRLFLITQILLTIVRSPELNIIIPGFMKVLPDFAESMNTGLLQFVLRRRVINSELVKFELEQIEAAGLKGEKARGELSSIVFQLYADYKETIEKFLIQSKFRFKENSMISPFLGIAKLLIKYKKLFQAYSEEGYKKSLQETNKYMAFFMQRCPRKKPVELAHKYRITLQKILAEKGWLSE